MNPISRRDELHQKVENTQQEHSPLTSSEYTFKNSTLIASMPTALPIFTIPLLWSATAQAAEPAATEIISRSGHYVNGKFTGKITARMTLPDLEKTIKICTGEDIANYRNFPGVREASYSNSTLKYVLTTPDIGFISVRDFGYSLHTSIDRSKAAEGITSVSWSNAGTQPTTDQNGNVLTNFTLNNGGWIFKRTPESGDNVYEVTWYVTTQVNPDTLQSGSGFVPDSTIAAQTLKDAEKVIKTLGTLSN